MVKKIYLVRHGQTESNSEGIVQGALDGLSARGREQALVLSDRIKKLTFDHLWVSDYERTKQTIAPALDSLSVSPVYTSLVRETKQPTSMVGISNQSEQFLEYYRLVTEHAHDPSWRFEDEETFYDVITRVKEFFTRTTDLEGDLLVVSHGRFITYLLMYVITEGKLDWDIWLKCRHGFETTNTGISVVVYNERYQGYRLLTFNDQVHLGE